jgi:hypothetical protein
LYYCVSVVFRFTGPAPLYKRFLPAWTRASRRTKSPSACAGLRLSKNSPPDSQPLNQASPRKAGAKVQPFPKTTSTFFRKIL